MSLYTTTYVFTPSFTHRGGTSNEVGARGYEQDLNDSTYWGTYVATGGDGDFSNTNVLTLTYEFSSPATISGLRLLGSTQKWGTSNNYENRYTFMYLYVYDWNGIQTVVSQIGASGKSNETYSFNYLDSTLRTNVKKVVVHATGWTFGDDSGGTQHLIHELKVTAADSGYGLML